MFSHLFGIRPWEWDLLTIAETHVLIGEANAWQRANQEANRGR